MVYLKRVSEERLFLRCIVSTFFGEGLDALVYIMLAFFGTMPTDALIVMVIVQAVVKTVYEIIVYPLTKHVISTVRALPDN